MSLLENFLANNLPMMVYGGELCLYERPRWRSLNKRQALVELRKALQKFDVAGSLGIKDYRELYELLLINPELVCNEELKPPAFCVNLADGVLNMQSGQFRAHDPSDGFFNFVDVDYEEIVSSTLEGPTFEHFVYNAGNGEATVRKQLLELTALALTGYEVKYFFVLLGPSHTGKTQFGRFLEELVGKEYVETIRGVADFGDKWTTGALVGKRLVTCLDLPDDPLPPVAVGTIKQLVGDDSLKGEKKFGNPFTFYKKPLLLMAGNHSPRIPKIEKEEAFLNRMVCIPFKNPVPESQMVQKIYTELLAESPYIIREAMYAFRDLADNNFSVTRGEVPQEYQPQEGNETIRSIQNFLDRCCAKNTNSEITTHALFEAYTASRYMLHISETDFARQIQQVIQSDSSVKRLSRVNGMERRGYKGLQLKEERKKLFSELS